MWNCPVFVFRCQFGSARRHIVTVELTVANTVSEHTVRPPQSAALCCECNCASVAAILSKWQVVDNTCWSVIGGVHCTIFNLKCFSSCVFVMSMVLSCLTLSNQIQSWSGLQHCIQDSHRSCLPVSYRIYNGSIAVVIQLQMLPHSLLVVEFVGDIYTAVRQRMASACDTFLSMLQFYFL